MSAHPPAAPRRLPPVPELAVAAMVLVIVGGVYMAANLPGDISLMPAVVLLCVSGGLLLVAVALLTRIRGFAWGTFRLVAGWALAGYLVIAGMIGYAFVHDGTPARPLAVLLAMLGVFAVVVPLLLGFSVARYQPPDGD